MKVFYEEMYLSESIPPSCDEKEIGLLVLEQHLCPFNPSCIFRFALFLKTVPTAFAGGGDKWKSSFLLSLSIVQPKYIRFNLLLGDYCKDTGIVPSIFSLLPYDPILAWGVAVGECLPHRDAAIRQHLHLLDVEDTVAPEGMAEFAAVAAGVLDDEASVAAGHHLRHGLGLTPAVIVTIRIDDATLAIVVDAEDGLLVLHVLLVNLDAVHHHIVHKVDVHAAVASLTHIHHSRPWHTHAAGELATRTTGEGVVRDVHAIDGWMLQFRRQPVLRVILIIYEDAAVCGCIKDAILEVQDHTSLVDDEVDEVELELTVEETCHT